MAHATAPTARDLGDCIGQIARSRTARARLLMEREPADTDLTAALLDAAAMFDELGVAFAVVGGLAAMVHGRARFTEDVDLVAVTGHEAVLAGNAEAMRRHRFDPTCTWKLYHESGAAVDICKDEHADGIVERAGRAELRGRRLPVAEPHDLIAMKLRAGRPQDDYDISEIFKRNVIDDDRVRGLVDAEQFAAYQRVKARAG